MQIRIITVGKLKEKYWSQAVGEYLKRLRPYAKTEIIEIDEERTPERPSPAEIRQALAKEGERIRRHLPPSCFVIPLAQEGTMLSSEELAAFLEKLAITGKSQATFIIGGSYGLSPEIKNSGDFLLSFSPLTFPHQMMRVFLLEQLYRSYKIMKGEPYHK